MFKSGYLKFFINGTPSFILAHGPSKKSHVVDVEMA